MSNIQLEQSWLQQLNGEFDKPYMVELKKFLTQELNHKKIIFPQSKDIFNAFNYTPFNETKVVIIGQDPYHGPNQAHGLCFSVQEGVKVPPSLKNIYKELESDLGFLPPEHGNLEHWAHSGVLLINTVLTVEQGRPASHKGRGWEQFTDKVIEVLNERKKNLVFILWGRDAKNKAQIVDRTRHFVLESAHPSPFSARMFFGNHHFSKANEYLRKHGIPEVDWKLH